MLFSQLLISRTSSKCLDSCMDNMNSHNKTMAEIGCHTTTGLWFTIAVPQTFLLAEIFSRSLCFFSILFCLRNCRSFWKPYLTTISIIYSPFLTVLSPSNNCFSFSLLSALPLSFPFQLLFTDQLPSYSVAKVTSFLLTPYAAYV